MTGNEDAVVLMYNIEVRVVWIYFVSPKFLSPKSHQRFSLKGFKNFAAMKNIWKFKPWLYK